MLRTTAPIRSATECTSDAESAKTTGRACRRRTSPFIIVAIIVLAFCVCLGISQCQRRVTLMHRDAAQDEVHAPLGQHPYRHQDPHQQQQKGQQEEGFSPTRRRVCDVVRRLYSMKHPHQPPPLLRAAGFPLASSHPELFEYLGLDRTAAPCHPASQIATTGPAHKKCRGAIAEAWLARVGEARILKGTSSATAGISATWPGEDSPAKLMQVARVRDSVVQGMSGPGDQWVDEVGLIHAVASTLLDDNSRAEYVNHILPVLRPSPQSWGSLWASTEILCPQPEDLNL